MRDQHSIRLNNHKLTLQADKTRGEVSMFLFDQWGSLGHYGLTVKPQNLRVFTLSLLDAANDLAEFLENETGCP